MEARYLKEQLETMLGGVEIFLDFDNLQETRSFNSWVVGSVSSIYRNSHYDIGRYIPEAAVGLV